MALVCAGPVGWLVVLAVGVPADRGEGSTSVIVGVVGGVAWTSLVLLSASLAFRGRGRRGALAFVPASMISLGVTAAPLILGALQA